MNGKAIVFKAVGEACLEEFEIPALKPDEVLIEARYSVISAGTEVANLKRLPNTVSYEKGFPHYPGYCGAGYIIGTGEEVETLNVGDRVVIQWEGHRSHVIKKEKDLLKIENDSIDLLEASFAHIASFSFLGVRKLGLEIGESTMIVGMGILGAFALQIASLSGAIPVLALDFDPERRKLARKLGAAAAFSPDEENLVEKVREATGGTGPDTVVEVTGSSDALRQALEYIAWEGRLSLLGCTRVSNVPIDYYKYVHCRGISIRGAHTFTRSKLESAPGRWTERDDYRTFLKLVAAKKLHVRPLISETVSPEDAGAIYTRLVEEKNPPLGIVFDWSKTK